MLFSVLKIIENGYFERLERKKIARSLRAQNPARYARGRSKTTRAMRAAAQKKPRAMRAIQ